MTRGPHGEWSFEDFMAWVDRLHDPLAYCLDKYFKTHKKFWKIQALKYGADDDRTPLDWDEGGMEQRYSSK